MYTMSRDAVSHKAVPYDAVSRDARKALCTGTTTKPNGCVLSERATLSLVLKTSMLLSILTGINIEK